MSPIGHSLNENPSPAPKPKSPTWPKSSEYGDALSGILKDQARRKELRSALAPTSGRRALHPFIPPILALVSVWLWAFPPAVLIPEVPTIPPAVQEAGLRMNMLVQFNQIQQFLSEYGRLPETLDEVGGRPDGVEYTRLSDGVFQLSGKSGDVTVDYTSTEPLAELAADAMAIVSGVSSTPPGAGADD